MNTITGGLMNFVAELADRREREQELHVAAKLRFLHHIVSKYHDQKSFFWWQNVIRSLPLSTLMEIEDNIEKLEKSGYPIKNRSGFFCSTLKKMGYQFNNSPSIGKI